MKNILLLWLLAVSSVSAQEVRVRFLWMDPQHEFNGVAGCPTNWPVAFETITGTNANYVVVSNAVIKSLYESMGPAFTNWYNQTYLPFVAAREAQQEAAREVNIQALRNLYQAFQDYEALASTGTPSNAQVLLEVRRLNGAFLRLGPVLKDLYRGDE